MSPHLAKVDAAIEPGLTMLNWTSLSLDAYMDSVYEALKELELLIDRANDLVKFRIEAVLQEMSNTPLCELPSDAPWTIEQFLKNTEVSTLLSVCCCCCFVTVIRKFTMVNVKLGFLMMSMMKDILLGLYLNVLPTVKISIIKGV